jgi:hypothetical protein
MDSVAVDVDEIADIVWPPGDSKMQRGQGSVLIEAHPLHVSRVRAEFVSSFFGRLRTTMSC